MSFVRFAWAALLFGLFAHAASQPRVLISEIMYQPPGTNRLEQWFELHNPGGQAVDLSGWRVTKGVGFEFPTGTSIPPGGYLVVAADAATFRARHPEVENFVAGWTDKLGHSLEITDARGAVVNALEFYGEGEWATRVLGAPHYNHRGWEWHTPAEGEGAAIELINPQLPNTSPHNWTATLGGTPGRPNTAASTDTAPFIEGVAHWPKIPRPNDPVSITARIVDENLSGAAVALHWRVDGQADFEQVAMLDDGGHGDAGNRDGVYGAILPAQPDHTVVEFFLRATDAAGNTRQYPAFVPPQDSPRTANLLYQVDSGALNGSQPIYRIIMTEAERAEIYALGRHCPDSDSDAQMNATWISSDGTGTEVRYNAGVRNRGHGSRQSLPNNYHINFPKDRPWKKQNGINLNSQFAPAQVIGSAVMRAAGLAMPDSRAVQVRVNSTNLMLFALNSSFNSYAANEQFDTPFLERSFPLDPDGNAYRGVRSAFTCVPALAGVADLFWRGADWAVPAYTNAYFKESNSFENDWSDLMKLLGVLNLTNGTTAETYVADVQKLVNVRQWMRYMAASVLLNSQETALPTGYGDDYALYRGVLDSRFQLLPYDMDSVMGRGVGAISPRDGLFRMTVLPVLDRFMKSPEFAPLYYQQLLELANTVFHPERINSLLDQLLSGFVPAATLDTMKAFNVSHRDYVLSQIPLTLTASASATLSNGYHYATSPFVLLTGVANAVTTRGVRVNGQSATWTAWNGTWTFNANLNPGVNRLSISSLDGSNKETARTNVHIWFDDGSVELIGGNINEDTRWSATAGPYLINTTIVVADEATLTVEPGTTIYLANGASLRIADGGRLLAEGSEGSPILFRRQPGATGNWGGIVIQGSIGSPETRIAHAHIEFNGAIAIHSTGATVALDHLTFGTTDRQYLSLDASSFVVRDCHFPAATAPFEPVHGAGGLKPGGRGIFQKNFFGAATGYNDLVDFTGGQRGGPIVYFVNNVFAGSGDDALDLDGTDAWIENNIFLHMHQNGSPDSASAVSGGGQGSQTSEITMVGNIVFDCDQAATAKEGDFFVLLNNTIVHTTKTGGTDLAAGALNVRDVAPELSDFAKGFYAEGNIIVDAEQLVRNYDANEVQVTFNNNILPGLWAGPGASNYIGDPLLRYIPTISETLFDSWQEAQIVREWFSLKKGSPAEGTGPGGKDKGAIVAPGVYVFGAPAGAIRETNARLLLGVNRLGFGWPQGAGYVAYKWRLDGGPWSAETPIGEPITVSDLSVGQHSIQITGKTDGGLYQDHPEFGDSALLTTVTWHVDPNAAPPVRLPIRINEILANSKDTPDLVELCNYGTTPLDAGGWGLSAGSSDAPAYVLPAGTVVEPGGFLTLSGDSGFRFKAEGDSLFLRDAGGGEIDSVQFGSQVPGFSLGRSPIGEWTLGIPTFGSANVAVSLGEPHEVRINEWLANAEFAARQSFVELYNSSDKPVALGGWHMSNAAGAPDRSRLPDLSFIGPRSFLVFTSDGADNTPGHLSFKLFADVGHIQLSDDQLTTIDLVSYGPQTTDISEGRTPNGSNTISFFSSPTPGAPNPVNAGSNTFLLSLNEVLAGNVAGGPDLLELFNSSTNRLQLAGLSLTDDLESAQRWSFKPGTVLEAHSYLVIGFDPATPANATNTGFGLDLEGGAVYLFDSPDRGGALLDAIHYGIQIPGVSIARVPDGSGEWTLGPPTFGQSNRSIALGAPGSLRINEWMARPRSGDDWFEIHNLSPTPVQLSGLFLTDDLTEREEFHIGPLSFIAGYGFLRFEADSEPGRGALHADFNLSADGEEIGLYDPLGGLIDSVSFGQQSENISEGRLPDGGASITALPSATPGASNMTTDSDRDGLPDHWEIAYFGGLARDGTADSDSDGMLDAEEFRAGTNPAAADDFLELDATGFSAGSFSLSVRTVAGRTYRLEYTDDLLLGVWNRLADFTAAGSGLVTVADTTRVRASRFYRVRVE